MYIYANIAYIVYVFGTWQSDKTKMPVGRFWRTCPSTENFRRQITAKRASPKVDLSSMTAVTAMADTYYNV